VQRPQEDLIPKFKSHTAARLPEVEKEDLRCHLTQGNPVASSIPVVPLVSLMLPLQLPSLRRGFQMSTPQIRSR
jgi:hypothetical protein